MIEIQIPKNFDVNAFECLHEGYEADLKKGNNIIGASEIPYGMKKIVIKKLKSIDDDTNFDNEGNAKMLAGKMFEDAVCKPNVLANLIGKINQQLNINPKSMGIGLKVSKLVEIEPGYFFRISPDILTNYYIIEIKTTGIYAREWIKELASHQVAQLNAQLGVFNIDLGFILKVNTRWEQANIKETDDYWKKLWDSYGYLIPWRFNKELYDKMIERLIIVIDHIKEKRWDDVPCPEFPWECYYCNENIRKICGKEEYQCSAPKCYRKMYEYPRELARTFIDFPQCENCFVKANPHSKYAKYKYLNYKDNE